MHFAPAEVDLFDLIPLWAHTVLDAGCGAATATAAFRRMNPKARLLGIQTEADAGTVTLEHMSEVVQADDIAETLPFELIDGIDCIIYKGMLERSATPLRIIRRHAAALNPDGVMLICLPNPDYWRAHRRLLADEQGDSYPRIFAERLFTERLEDTGLTMVDVIRHEPDPDEAAAYIESMTPALVSLGIDPAEYGRRVAPAYVTWRVRKEPRQRVILSGSMLAPVGGVSHVRVVHPLEAIATDPGFDTTVTTQVSKPAPNDITPRIFVLHRPALMGQPGLQTLQTLHAAGFLIVTEFDDHPEHFEMIRNGGELSFRGVHALQTSTAALADVLRKYNPEVAVFPNAIPSLPDVRNFAESDSITLFFGALNRERDWRPFMPVLNAAAQTAGDRLKFQIVHDHGFFEALETSHKAFTPTCDYDTYLHLLGSSEISFMPLADTPFNRAKSDLKFIEAASCRTVPLASTVVYGDSIDDGRTGLLFRDPVELHDRLLRLVAMPELARGLGDAAREHVASNRMLAYQVAPRIAWYRSLWARRDVLNKALSSRMAAA